MKNLTFSAMQVAFLMFFTVLSVVASYGLALYIGAWAILAGAFMIFVVWATIVSLSKPGSTAKLEDEGVLLMVVFILGLWGSWMTIHPAVAIAIFVIIASFALSLEKPGQEQGSAEIA